MWLAVVSCGGRESGGGPSGTTPEARCNDVCRHIIGTCSFSADIKDCAEECQKTATDFATCAELDAFFDCMLTANVTCSPGEATVLGCDDERELLTHCRP
jgi:hypothetical protein